jgi:hypothetical protein
MHKSFVGIGLIALAGMLTASTVLAASHPRSAAVAGQPMQLAKEDAKAPAAGQPHTKKKHKRSKKGSHGKDAAQGAPAEK